MQGFVVKINEGSGCLFQPITTEYSYVLTAKHVITNYEELIIDRYLIDDQGIPQNETQPLKIIGTPYFHQDGSIDAAIIKVEKTFVQNIFRMVPPFSNNGTVLLTGYPTKRRGSESEYREDVISIRNVRSQGNYEGELGKIAGYSEIAGQSGGAIIKVIDGIKFLLGIQSKMAEEDEDENLGRIVFLPLSHFDDIITQNKNDLLPLLPPYLICFSFLKDEVFNLNAGIYQENIEYTKKFLKRKVEDIVKSKTTPYIIRDYFKKRLLIYNQSDHTLDSKTLWKSWLELLIVMSILKYQRFTESEINEIFGSIRLLYSEISLDWSSEMLNILKSDFKGLKNNGTVIISTNGPARQFELPRGSIPYLDRVKKEINPTELQIDEGITFPLDNYHFIHISALQEQIQCHSSDYSNFDASNEIDLLKKLKTEYEFLFNKQ